MKVLVACEFSGIVREAFQNLGHQATSCDLLDTEIPGNHYKGDIKDILYDGWDLMIAFPPCTYLANSGVRWLYGGKGTARDPVRWKLMEEAAKFFQTLLDAPIDKIAVENPIMHLHAGIRKPDQIIQPWQFGHGEIKSTALWLKNLPKLVPTNIVEGRANRVHFSPDSKDRWKKRSRTLSGIAQAMAEQWGEF
jgi:hypothetical protein